MSAAQTAIVVGQDRPASGVCRRCGKLLTDPLYVARGTGRVCGGPIRTRRHTTTSSPAALPGRADLEHPVPVVDGQEPLWLDQQGVA